jgi:hypothetical protein
MSDTANFPLVATTEGIAFFTTGDTRASRGVPATAPAAAKLNSSERYKKRAESLVTAARVHGVATILEATAVLQALAADVKITKVFFVGHGFDDGFFLHGRPDPKDADNFIADDQDMETVQDPAKAFDPTAGKQRQQAFLDELVKHLHKPSDVEIGFLSCFTGTGSTVSAFGKALEKAGFAQYHVGGYRNDYQTLYDFDKKTGAIKKWRDSIFDRKSPSTVLKQMDNNQIPPYETECGKSPDPLSTRLPC